jgi:hypothetical protein
MDSYLIVKTIANRKKNLEKLDDNSNNSKDNIMTFGTLLSIIIGAYASYLSYTCSSRKNIPELHKIFFAIFAYFFGFFYLIYYYLFKYESCEL